MDGVGKNQLQYTVMRTTSGDNVSLYEHVCQRRSELKLATRPTMRISPLAAAIIFD